MTPLPFAVDADRATAVSPTVMVCVACSGRAVFAYRAANRQGDRAWPFYRCDDCGALRLDAGEDQPTTGLGDDDGSYGDDAGGRMAELQRRLQLRLLAPEVDVVVAQLANRPSPRVLEIGCGAGLLAEAVLSCRPDVAYHGVEPRPEAAREAKARGVTIVGKGLAELEAEFAPFDAIVMIHVLEHLDDPIAMLRELRARLTPRGTLVISVPVADSWEARLFGPRWYGLFPPHHRWLPTVRALHRVATEAAFHVILTTWRSYRTPLVGTVSSQCPFLEPARLRALAPRAPLRSLIGQVALAIGLVLALPLTLLANAAGRGSSVMIAARAEETA